MGHLFYNEDTNFISAAFDNQSNAALTLSGVLAIVSIGLLFYAYCCNCRRFCNSNKRGNDEHVEQHMLTEVNSSGTKQSMLFIDNTNNGETNTTPKSLAFTRQ
jgi:hypothetical protein